MQAKLLRVLQEREFMRLGAKYSTRTDVRILATTNRNLQEEIRLRNFREDLYFRLNVIPLVISPLRHRKDDIPLLATYFCQNLCAENGKPVMEISPRAMSVLQAMDWPGNVRQLQNAIESSIAVATKEIIGPENLPDPIRPAKKSVFLDTSDELEFKSAKERIVKAFERQYLTGLLEKHGNNISKVALEAKLNRKSIYRMLESLQINIRNKSD